MTLEIILVFSVLVIIIFLFVSELLRVDVIALLIMISLPWLGLIEPLEAFSGLASNAVVSIIAVMILGYGIDRSGIMKKVTRPIICFAGSSQSKLIALVSGVVGIISAFIQNIGAAALFLPVMIRISKKRKIAISRLLMPIGFAAILGGTLTMVASSPLIILNDLLKQGGEERFGLFSVTPLGLTLLAAGIGYFLTFGKFLLPAKKENEEKISPQKELIETWELPSTIHQCSIPEESPLVTKDREDALIWEKYNLNLLAIGENYDVLYAPWRHTDFAAGQTLALLGREDNFERFVEDYDLSVEEDRKLFGVLKSEERAGFAEIVIHPQASIVGKSIRDISLRKNYRVEPIMLLSGSREIRSDFSDEPLNPGDIIIVHGRWTKIKDMGEDDNFVLITPAEIEITGKSKPVIAMLCFLGAIVLALSGVPLSLGLLSGAIAMIVLDVVEIDEVYKAIDWRTVFLLAGLIPLGAAMDNTGAASFVANQIMQLLKGSHTILILLAVAVLSTLFSLFMSNVAATVLLVPLVMIVGENAGINPRGLALLVGICASNSFVLPTHQVNALLMSPGGYHNSDYLKVGSVMTAIFIIIAIGFIYLFFI